MQPLMRQSKRAIPDSISIIRASKSNRNFSTRSLTLTSTCIQCQSHLQRRHFADDTKPNSPSTPSPISPQTNNGPSHPPYADSELPSASDSRRSAASKRLSEVMDHLQGNIFIASQRLNDLTGYSGIEALKQSIREQETHLETCQETVRTARQNYKQTVADRAASQREVTTLLARKDTWTATDLERFTNLYRSDHGNEQAVQEAAARLAEGERLAEQAAGRLSTSILSRYHEEQIWSDKIRRMSTWGTWGLMGVNIFIFLVFQFGFEPWRRQRLVRGFEEKVQEALRREKERLAQVREGEQQGGEDERSLDAVVAAGAQELEMEMEDAGTGREPACDALAAVIHKDAADGAASGGPKQKLRTPPSGLGYPGRLHTWRAGVLDLFSDRMVSLRKQDVTIVALEGAATGAALVSLLTLLILRRS